MSTKIDSYGQVFGSSEYSLSKLLVLETQMKNFTNPYAYDNVNTNNSNKNSNVWKTEFFADFNIDFLSDWISNTGNTVGFGGIVKFIFFPNIFHRIKILCY